MAILRDRPYSNCNFLVDFDDGKAWHITGGFSEVIFPPFVIAANPRRTTSRSKKTPPVVSPTPYNPHLILRRGVIGSLDLYTWWNKARQGKAPARRAVRIHLLGDDHRTTVMSWHFSNVRPVVLAYAPLQANEPGVLIETLEIAFDRMEMQ